MSENIEKKAEPILAVLAEGEPLISPETAEKFKKFAAEARKEPVKEVPETEAEEPVVAKEEATNNVISSEIINKPTKPKAAALGSSDKTVLISSVANVPNKPVQIKDEKETIAIHSTRNVSWNGVGKVSVGYNIVTKSAADKWLTRGHIRLATPEEVAKEYNK